jgi:hypothetical protein
VRHNHPEGTWIEWVDAEFDDEEPRKWSGIITNNLSTQYLVEVGDDRCDRFVMKDNPTVKVI